ncbi:MAG: choice-of-anchor M domain-containing protein [Planctomycetaceae bacterium]|nr:choice-of-anchor M domain-containing protein [Planctomycetaceae bacterium]
MTTPLRFLLTLAQTITDRAMAKLTCCAVLCAASTSQALPLDPVAEVLTVEHTDISSGYSGGWNMSVQGYLSGTLAPHQALLFVDRPARGNRPAGTSFDFVGVAAGQKYWRLPQSQNSKLLYLGANSYGTDFLDVASYVESDPRVGATVPAPWIKCTVTGVHGLTPETPAPGAFSIWSSEDAGPNVWVSSAQGGLTSQDGLFIIAQGHAHFNWGFTARGIYGIDIVASAYLGPGKTNPTASETYTFYFGVEAGLPGDATLDSIVDGADYTLWADRYLSGPDATWRDGDFNLDGLVDGADYTIWADHFGTGMPEPSLAVSAVPEPSTLGLGLVAASLGALTFVRRRCRWSVAPQ